MKKTKLCIDLIQNAEIELEEQIPIIKDCGFDGIFTCFWDEERMKRLATLAKNHALAFQSVHAPFSDVVSMWREKEDAKPFI